MNAQVAERVDEGEGIEDPPDAEDPDGTEEGRGEGAKTLDDIIDAYSEG